MHTLPRLLRPLRHPGRVRSKTSFGRSWTSSNEKVYDFATKRNSCAGNSTIDNPSTLSRIHSRERYLVAPAAIALTHLGFGQSAMLCSSARQRWRPLRRRRAPPARPRPRPRPRAPRWAASTRRSTRLPDPHASPRPTPRSSRRFSSRVILSNFKGNCSPPPYRIRYVKTIHYKHKHIVV